MGFPTDERYTYLVEPFGTTRGRSFPHTGDDWARRKKSNGQALQAKPIVKAVFSGTVIASGWHAQAGNRIVIRYWFGRVGVYAHLDSRLVAVGNTVSEGQTIGLLGGTGKVSGPHLHYSQYTSRERALSGIVQYWQGVKWPNVTAWATASGLVRPDYKVGTKTGAPTTPVKTPKQIEEEELMSAREDILRAIKHEANRLDERTQAEARAIESRIKRAIWPEPHFIQVDNNGKTYTIDDSPYAALMSPSGFIMPLDAPDSSGKRGQINSLMANYRVIASDSKPVGMSENAFWNQIKDIARGAGIIDRNISHDAGVAWAKSLFSTD